MSVIYLSKRMLAIADEVERLEKWRDAVLDACDSCWVTPVEGDPRATLARLIDWEVKAALDPALSADARRLAGMAEGAAA